MRNKKPPFEITNRMIDYVAEIAELLGTRDLVCAFFKPYFAPQQPNPHHTWVVGN